MCEAYSFSQCFFFFLLVLTQVKLFVMKSFHLYNTFIRRESLKCGYGIQTVDAFILTDYCN